MRSRKGIIYTQEQLLQFSETIPAQEVLEWCRDRNFMLVPGPDYPMSLLEIRNLKNDYFYSKEGGWYECQEFSKSDKVQTRWYMISKDIVLGSTSKNWDEQQVLLSGVETTPNAPEFVWAVTTYKAVRGVHLFDGISARTSSLSLDGNHVNVGGLNNLGLLINDYMASYRFILLGLAVARV